MSAPPALLRVLQYSLLCFRHRDAPNKCHGEQQTQEGWRGYPALWRAVSHEAWSPLMAQEQEVVEALFAAELQQSPLLVP